MSIDCCTTDTGARDESPAAALRDALLVVRSLAQASGSVREMPDPALIDMLADVRRLRAVTAALEAEVVVAFDAAQRAMAMSRGVPRRDAGRGVADQVALARGVSVYRAANDLALARGLVTELPVTMGLLAAGVASESAVYSVAKETVCLEPDDRAVVDERIGARLAGMSARRAANQTRAEAAKVDGESVTRRIRRAYQDRGVTVRPAPDAMVYLSALLPVKEGVAAYAALCRHADSQKAVGDERSRAAIMADELFARVSGFSTAAHVPVEVQLVMPAATFVTQDGVVGQECGWMGEHPIPAEIAREIALIADSGAQRWVRRLFTDPLSGEVVGADERRRFFGGATRRAIVARDRACRMCGAPIRQIDHVVDYAAGGATTLSNGQGLCVRCNQAKSLPGWDARSFVIEGHHVTVTRTPTGHRYVSRPPPTVTEPPRRKEAPLEMRIQPRLREVLPSRFPVSSCRADLVVPRANPIPGRRSDKTTPRTPRRRQ
ncbi:HNH endonuclease [Cumulibacter soli]|uniref:HNH endonuclease n=1 Tax=Cumulibacter soli TaxID=2546344 RepID=UPI001068C80C|nr:HNH endonuclease [Cumulibacter soli]